MNTDRLDVWIAWNEYHRLIEQLAVQIHDSGWQANHLLCLARGGLRIGDVFSRVFKLPLSILSVSSYRGENGTSQEQIIIGKHLSQVTEGLAGKVLLIDDLADSGVTMLEVEKWLHLHHPNITEVKSAVIWVKSSSITVPDYYIERVEGNPWIHQPFESYDDQTIDDVKSRVNPVVD